MTATDLGSHEGRHGLAALYEDELLNRVLPFWLKHGWDRSQGGYFTGLARDGRVYDSRKYVWLNGRAAWTFSRLYNELAPNAEWLEFAGSCARFLKAHAFDAEGRVYFSLTRDGAPAFFQRKPYSAVFVALGFLEYARATGDQEYLELGVDLFWKICSWIDDTGALGRPHYGGPVMSQLADIMVVALLALEIARFDSTQKVQDKLAWCLSAVKDHWHSDRRLLFENALPSVSGFRETPEGRFFCPGSVAEVGWFLLHVLERFPDSEIQHLLLDAIEGALEFGWDAEFGGLYYFMDTEGLPMLPLEWNMKLWWPHTEALYATILAHSLTGDAKWARWHSTIHDYTFAQFPDREFGEWFGYRDRRNHLTHTLKGNNYKGAFHVPRALLFSSQRVRKPIP